MNIVVYLNNGQVRSFSQEDPALIQAMVAEVQPNRLFASSSLILGSGSACAVLHSAAVSRIDVVTDQPIAIQPTIKDSATVVESEEAFKLRSMAATKAFREGVAPGEAYQGYMRFELAGGHCLLIELQRILQQQAQFFTNLHRLFEGNAMVFPHPRGGAVILNVANIVSVDAAPGFAEYPKGTLLVECS